MADDFDGDGDPAAPPTTGGADDVGVGGTTDECAVGGLLDRLDPDSFLPLYVRQAARETDAPACYHVGAALTLLSAAIPPAITVPGLPGGEVPGNLFVVLVGRQGADRKTTAVEFARRLLGRVDARRIGDEPGSAEGFDKSIAAASQQLVFFEEMGDFFAKTKERTGGNYATELKTRLLRMFDRTPIRKRYSRHSIHCPNPHVSVLGGVNPALVSTHVTMGDWNNGYMSRNLLLWGTAERYLSRVDRSANDWPRLRQILKCAIEIRADAYGRCLGLSPDAHDVWEEWDRGLRDSMETMSLAGVGPRARAPHIAIRIALLLAFGEGLGWPRIWDGQDFGDPFWITARHLLVGAEIATWGYRSALVLASYATDDDDMRRRRAVLLAVGEQWTPLGNILGQAHILKVKAGPILQSLEEEGLIVGDVKGTRADGRRCSRYKLVPMEDASFRILGVRAPPPVPLPDYPGVDPAELWNANPATTPEAVLDAAVRVDATTDDADPSDPADNGSTDVVGTWNDPLGLGQDPGF